jgi:hypothetical protein
MFLQLTPAEVAALEEQHELGIKGALNDALACNDLDPHPGHSWYGPSTVKENVLNEERYCPGV